MRSGILFLAYLVSLVAAAMTFGCSSAGKDANITGFVPASGKYQPGEEAVSSMRVENNTTEKHTLWVGYSVQDEGGGWHDAPARPVRIEGGESALVTRSWEVPEAPLPRPEPTRW